ncbi:unnamed protein product [Protopolystoma xenopodis]|uniref:Uncharacterized protein n=1 Tax=Protopolystoma xenopodis TaxID=117903 RepID=A0A448WIJ6_9PLAT|nr:unnamed protein product [Protopolystoma xenopodis]
MDTGSMWQASRAADKGEERNHANDGNRLVRAHAVARTERQSGTFCMPGRWENTPPRLKRRPTRKRALSLQLHHGYGNCYLTGRELGITIVPSCLPASLPDCPTARLSPLIALRFAQPGPSVGACHGTVASEAATVPENSGHMVPFGARLTTNSRLPLGA